MVASKLDLVLGVIAVQLFAGLSSVSGQDPARTEAPDDPPAALGSRPVDDPLARTPAAIVERDGYVSIQVNIDEFGNNIAGDAGNEPSIAVDPTDPDRMVIGWRQFDTIQSNFRQAGMGYTQDGGQTWTFPGVLDPGVFRSDPVLGADAEGTFHYYSLSTVESCELFSSFDAGVSWIGPLDAFGGDKAWMAVDDTNGIGSGHIYAKWQTFSSCCGPNTFIRSTDGGATFDSPIPVPGGPSFGTMTVGTDGTLYIAGIEMVDFVNFNQFIFAKSTDAQDPESTPTFTATEVDLGGAMGLGGDPNPGGLLGQAIVGVGPAPGIQLTNVYMLASVDPPGPDPMDVHFVRSNDGGATWSAPVRVNDDPTDNQVWQWFGTISVAPNGRIDVIWNDTRTAGRPDFSELYHAYSFDGGTTFSASIPVSPLYNSHVGWPQQEKLGDYYDMTSDEFGAHVAYAATFNGEQDVYYLRIAPDCNNNGIHDGEDIIGGAEDCNGNFIPDECEPDCNENGVADECDIDEGTSEDCNGNTIPDECDLDFGVYMNSSERLSPIGKNRPQSYIVESPPAASGMVTFEFEASADLSDVDELINVDVNGVHIGTAFVAASDCPAEPDTDMLAISAALYNQAVDGGDAVINMVASNVVSPTLCEPPSFISVAVLYPSEALEGDCNDNGIPDDCDIADGTSEDTNGNSIPDECECLEDLDGSGTVDFGDILAVLSAWGACGGDCPEDLDGSGAVDFGDILRVLAAWGPCP